MNTVTLPSHTNFHYHSSTHPVLQFFALYIAQRRHRVRDTPSYAPALNLGPLIGYLKWLFHWEFGDFRSGVMEDSDLLAHEAMSTGNGFHCFEGTKNASWTTWSLKMRAPRTFETSWAIHPWGWNVAFQNIGILDRFIVFLATFRQIFNLLV